MPGVFEALSSLKEIQKKHIVTIEGQAIEVTLEDKIKILQHGENNYIVKDGVPELKKIIKQRNIYAELEEVRSDPFWPTEEFTWKR